MNRENNTERGGEGPYCYNCGRKLAKKTIKNGILWFECESCGNYSEYADSIPPAAPAMKRDRNGNRWLSVKQADSEIAIFIRKFFSEVDSTSLTGATKNEIHFLAKKVVTEVVHDGGLTSYSEGIPDFEHLGRSDKEKYTAMKRDQLDTQRHGKEVAGDRIREFKSWLAGGMRGYADICFRVDKLIWDVMNAAPATAATPTEPPKEPQ